MHANVYTACDINYASVLGAFLRGPMLATLLDMARDEHKHAKQHILKISELDYDLHYTGATKAID